MNAQKRLALPLSVIALIILLGIVVFVWRINTPYVDESGVGYAYHICSQATSDKKALVKTSCFYDSCGYQTFDMDGTSLGTASGDGSMAGESAAKAQLIKDDCWPIPAWYFNSRVKDGS